MQERDDAILSELGIAEWLEAYQHISASAVGKRGPIRPGPGKVYDVVPGPYPDWHYVALALRKLLETVAGAEIRDREVGQPRRDP